MVVKPSDSRRLILWCLWLALATLVTFAGAYILYAFQVSELYQTIWWLTGMAVIWASLWQCVVTAQQKRAALVVGGLAILFSFGAVLSWLLSAPIA